MAEIICKYCGKPKKVMPSEVKIRQFCCREHYLAHTRERKKYCGGGCGTEITVKTAYNRSKDPDQIWLDNLCKACRIKANGEAYKRRRARQGREIGDTERGKLISAAQESMKTRTKVCGWDNQERGTKKTWISRMTQNPYLFQHEFRVAATPENIAKEAEKLGL